MRGGVVKTKLRDAAAGRSAVSSELDRCGPIEEELEAAGSIGVARGGVARTEHGKADVRLGVSSEQ